MVSPERYYSPEGFVIQAREQAQKQRRRQVAHAQLGAVAFVLILAVIFVQLAVTDERVPEPPETALAAAAEAQSTSTPPMSPPPTVTPSPTTIIRQAAIMPSPTKLIPTVTPTPEQVAATEVDATANETEEPELAATEDSSAPTDATAEAAAGDDGTEEEAAADDPQPGTAQGSVAVPVLDPAWDAAIHTWDGGVMGIVSSSELNIRASPSAEAEIVDTTWMWRPVVVYDTVLGDWVGETNVWYALGGRQFVSAAFIEPFVPALPAGSHSGTWVDVNLTTGYAVAYQDDTPVYATMVAYGKPGFETPLGEHTIFARVESDTLDSSTVGIPDGDRESYLLTDVPYVQYFAEGGFALHANYWDATWELGGPTSHGCINLTTADAAFFWNFLELGSVVSIHE